MAPASLLAALVLSLAAAPAVAAEPFLARVLSIEPDRVVLMPADRKESGAEPLTAPIDGTDLPSGLSPGSLVRVWPGEGGRAGSLTSGTRLAPLGGDLRAPDRTGVRARLMYGAERGFGGRRGGR